MPNMGLVFLGREIGSFDWEVGWEVDGKLWFVLKVEENRRFWNNLKEEKAGSAKGRVLKLEYREVGGLWL